MPKIATSQSIFKPSPNDAQVFKKQGDRSIPDDDSDTDTPPTKEFFVPYVQGDDTTIQAYPVARVDDQAGGGTQSASVSFMMPSDFTSLTAAYLVIVAQTGHNDWNILVSAAIAKEGDDYQADTNSDTFTPDLQTDNMEEVDISSILTTVTALDYVGIELENKRSDDQFYFLGLRVKYT